jgi:hypothetical protein
VGRLLVGVPRLAFGGESDEVRQGPEARTSRILLWFQAGLEPELPSIRHSNRTSVQVRPGPSRSSTKSSGEAFIEGWESATCGGESKGGWCESRQSHSAPAPRLPARTGRHCHRLGAVAAIISVESYVVERLDHRFRTPAATGVRSRATPRRLQLPPDVSLSSTWTRPTTSAGTTATTTSWSGLRRGGSATRLPSARARQASQQLGGRGRLGADQPPRPQR